MLQVTIIYPDIPANSGPDCGREVKRGWSNHVYPAVGERVVIASLDTASPLVHRSHRLAPNRSRYVKRASGPQLTIATYTTLVSDKPLWILGGCRCASTINRNLLALASVRVAGSATLDPARCVPMVEAWKDLRPTR